MEWKKSSEVHLWQLEKGIAFGARKRANGLQRLYKKQSHNTEDYSRFQRITVLKIRIILRTSYSSNTRDRRRTSMIKENFTSVISLFVISFIHVV